MTPVLLPAGSALVGDLHLDPLDGACADGLARWAEALEPPVLVVMGDLFDAWVGPAHEATPGGRAVIELFRRLTARGVRVELLHGNRDFLLGESFERASGARVWPAGLEAMLEDGTRVLVLHGDELCTRDVKYQRLRCVVRSETVRWLAPRVPLAVAGRVARGLRRASVAAVAEKLPEEKAMQRDACREWARTRGAAVVVCGHAHEGRDERVAGEGVRWLVVDAWGGERDVVWVRGAGELVLAGRG